MSKSTPGPWKVLAASFTRDNAVQFEVYMGDHPEISAANANLIAAAPELLEALEIATHPDYTNPESMVRIAKAAIAKAKGES